MIFIGETNSDVDNIKQFPQIRSVCGADAIVSTKPFPPVSETLVRKHVESGAFLYRIVTPTDIKNVEAGRLLVNLNKMKELGAKPWQSVLLLDASRTVLDYELYMKKVDAWVLHGGVFMDTLGMPLRHYLDWRDSNPMKQDTSIVYPVYKSPQSTEIVTDWRSTVATFPGIGYAGANTIQKLLVEKNQGNALIQALCFLTDWNEYKTSSGNWKIVRKKARDWMGLPDEFDLDLKITVDED
jgi:hypothetical protein